MNLYLGIRNSLKQDNVSILSRISRPAPQHFRTHYSASQKKGNPISQEYIFIKEKAGKMILCSSLRAFNLLSFDTKHDMMHSRMTDQEQFKRGHVRIDLHRIMDVCGCRQDRNNN